jgi:hypothetical protein
MLRKKAKKGPGVEVPGIDGQRSKSHEDAIGRAAIAPANPPARTFRRGHSSGVTFEKLYSLAATRETTDRIGSGTMACA